MYSCVAMRGNACCLGRRLLFTCGPRTTDVQTASSEKQPTTSASSKGNGSVSSLPGHLTNTIFSGDGLRGGHATRNSNGHDSNFYNMQRIAKLSEKKSTRLTPRQLMYATKAGEPKYLVRSAAYLHNELPIRVAHMVRRFQQLPHLVGLNPHIASVHQLYIKAYKVLTSAKSIETVADEIEYSKLVRQLLDSHGENVTTLARGFRECRSLMPSSVVKEFLDSVVTSRLGIRMLAEHHLAMHTVVPGHIGMITTKLSPAKTISDCALFARSQCERRFCRSPELEVTGHTNAAFPYFAMPLQYMLEEVLKNAMRATAEHHRHAKTLPPVVATVCNNDSDFSIRVSDHGGGIRTEQMSRIYEYMFTTSDERSPNTQAAVQDIDTGAGMNFIFDDMVSSSQSSAGPMSGFGFGLPTSRAFAAFLGGSLNVLSMHGLGTDVYIHLKHFDSAHHTIYL